MANKYGETEYIDEFGRSIPYENLKAFPKGTSKEIIINYLDQYSVQKKDGSVTHGNEVKKLLGDTYGFYGQTENKHQGRKMYVGDIYANYSEDTGYASIAARVINDKENLQEKPRLVRARITPEQYNEYMASTDDNRLRLAGKYLKEIELESTKDRIVEVKDVTIDRDAHIIQARIDGDTIQRPISENEITKMTALSYDKKEKMLSQMFDAKGVKASPDQNRPAQQVMNAITNSNTSTMPNTLAQSQEEKQTLSTTLAKQDKIEDLAQAADMNFNNAVEKMEKETEQSQKSSLSR